MPHDVKEYPTAGHAFLDDALPAMNPVLALLVEEVLSFSPDPEAAADARARIDAFVREHLAPSA